MSISALGWCGAALGGVCRAPLLLPAGILSPRGARVRDLPLALPQFIFTALARDKQLISCSCKPCKHHVGNLLLPLPPACLLFPSASQSLCLCLDFWVLPQRGDEWSGQSSAGAVPAPEMLNKTPHLKTTRRKSSVSRACRCQFHKALAQRVSGLMLRVVAGMAAELEFSWNSARIPPRGSCSCPAPARQGGFEASCALAMPK